MTHALPAQNELHITNPDNFIIGKVTEENDISANRQEKNFLLIKHSDGWHDDRCARWLKLNGYPTLTHISREGEALPDVKDFSHVLVYGGAPCVKDAAQQHHLQSELQLIEAALYNDVACMGICLGAQMIAHVLGARVKPLPCGTTEFGFSVITPTQDGTDFMQQPFNMLQWHCEGFDLPDDCTLLATGNLFPNQAFRYGSKTFGLQFHPEVTAEVLQCWHRQHLAGTSGNQHLRNQQLSDCVRHANTIDIWCDQFMRKWAFA